MKLTKNLRLSKQIVDRNRMAEHWRILLRGLALQAVLSMMLILSAQAQGNVVDNDQTAVIPGTSFPTSSMTVGKDTTGTLIIEQGASFRSLAAIIGQNVGSSGTVIVRDGSTWNVQEAFSPFLVGFNGTGSLHIESGGKVVSNASQINGLSEVFITGIGSQWSLLPSPSEEHPVRLDIDGKLEVTEGGSLNSAGPATVQRGGSMKVTGSGTDAVSAGEISIFSNQIGNSTLSIENGATVRSHDGSIWSHDGATSTAVITGVGSRWLVNEGGQDLGSLEIGAMGFGSLLIENGGSATIIGETKLGESEGTNGTLTIRGSGSSFTSLGLAIGKLPNTPLPILGGSGTLHVEQGGLADTSYTLVGASDGSNGTITVTGAGSRLYAYDFWVAERGRGTLMIEEGGFVDSEFSDLGLRGGSSAEVTVTGPGSQWSNGSDLRIGPEGRATLTITDGASVHANYVSMGFAATGEGTLNISGSEGRRGVMTAGTIRGGSGSSSIVLDGGVLRARNAGTLLTGFSPGDIVFEEGGTFLDTAGNNVGIDANLSGVGNLTKQGLGVLTFSQTNTYGGNTILEGGGLALSGTGTLGAGFLQMASGTIFDISGKADGLAIDNLQGGGTIILGANTLALDAGSFSGFVIGSGSLVKRGAHTFAFDGIGTFTGGTMIENGTLVAHAAGLGIGPVNNNGHLVFDQTMDGTFHGVIFGAGTVEKKGSGTLELTGPLSHDYAGLTTVNAGTLRLRSSLKGDVQVNAGGIFEGDGSVEAVTVVDGGTLVGAAGTRLSMSSLALGSGSVLDVTLMPSAGALFDVANNVSLNGELRINVNSDLGIGTFQLMEYGGLVSGNGLTLRNLPADYSPDSLSLVTDGNRVSLVISAVTGDQYWKGGAGKWSTGQDWKDAGGNLNMSWGGRKAIFGATGGDVAVEGSQSFDSLHFESAGYRLHAGTGGELKIAGTDGFVRVNNGMAASLDLPVTGNGKLVKMGAGTLILSADNDYVGGTQIQAGSVLGSVASFGSGDIENDGILEIRQETNAAFGATVSGSGMLNKSGAGLLELTGTNTYAGGTNISGGKLLVTRDANLGASSGGITFNNGTLVFGSAFDLSADRGLVMNTGSGVLDTNGFDVTLHSPISGGATFVKDGLGTLTLLGKSSHQGATIIGHGTLIANAGSLGSGTITNMGTLVIDQAGNAAMAQQIDGGGDLVKRGAGRLDLTGNSGLTGDTFVQEGDLAVNGSLSSSDVIVGSNAVLSGTGSVGSLAAHSNATIAPGNSIGTLKVAGNVSFGLGSVYQVEVNPAGQSDRIAASGMATLSGGTVQVLAESGSYKPSTSYTILTASGGVGGRFANASSNFAFLEPTLKYQNKAVTLTLTRKTDPTDPIDPTDPGSPPPLAFHSVAVSSNQYRTADAIEALGTGNRLFDAVVGQGENGARQAFDALSGEAHASAVTTAFADVQRVKNTILNRLGNGSGQQLSDVVPPSFDAHTFTLWGQGFGSWGRVGSNGNAAGMDTSTGGFILGAEAKIDGIYNLGIAGGFMSTSFDIDGRMSSGSTETIFASVYGTAKWDAINLRLGVLYAAHDVDVNRTITFPGFRNRVGSSYDGSTLMAFGEIGYEFDLDGAKVEPFLGTSLMRLHVDGFQEEGGAAALVGHGHSYDIGTTTLGIRVETRLSDELPIILRGMVGWRHAFGDVEASVLLAFSGGASAFEVTGLPIDRNTFVAEAGLDWQINKNIALGVSYSGQIGVQVQEHSVKGSFVWRFGTH